MDRDYRTLTAVEWRMVAEAFPGHFARLLVRAPGRGVGGSGALPVILHGRSPAVNLGAPIAISRSIFSFA